MILTNELEDYREMAEDSDVQKAKRILKDANHILNVKQSKNKFKITVPSKSRNAP